MRIRMGRRLIWASVFALLLWATAAGRLFQLQVAKSGAYSQIAFNQRTLSLPVGDPRGKVFDRYGVPLSSPQTKWGVAVFPPLVSDVLGTARVLAPVLRRSEEELAAAIRKGHQPFWIDLRPAPDAAEQVSTLHLPGVSAGQVDIRYGGDSLARHLVGYLNQDGGQLGLERAFNQDLTGDDFPALTVFVDGLGHPMGGLGIRTMKSAAGKEPYDLYTTIDGRIQLAIEDVLNRHTAPDGKPLKGAVAVLDPYTGDVLALASRPQFDYDRLDELLKSPDGGSFLLNRTIKAYAPGSVFKALVAAAALEAGLVQLDEHFYCPGHYDVGTVRFTDLDGKGHGDLTFRDALAKSCNITFLKVGYERLGLDGLREVARRFGFGQPTYLLGTGKAWPEEQAGTIPGEQDDSTIQLSFGQGSLSVSPLQMARAFSALANGGTLPPVRLITAVKRPSGEVTSRPVTEAPMRVISTGTARLVRESLEGVTDPNGVGTGKGAWVAEGGSAGKTGSAEGKDVDGKSAVHAWFAGYFPRATPRFVMVVMVEEGNSGGGVAAPLWADVARAINAAVPAPVTP